MKDVFWQRSEIVVIQFEILKVGDIAEYVCGQRRYLVVVQVDCSKCAGGGEYVGG